MRFSSIFIRFVAFLISLTPFFSFGQEELWQDISTRNLSIAGQRDIVPSTYRSIALDVETLEERLSGLGPSQSLEVALPLPESGFLHFRVKRASVMADGLAARFPDIFLFEGRCLEDSSLSIRMDVTPKGFHAMVLGGEEPIYVDPYSRSSRELYISYDKEAFIENSSKVLVEEEEWLAQVESGEEVTFSKRGTYSVGSQMRVYRIVVGATGEYTAFHGGTVNDAMAAIATTLNRINGVFERELCVRLELVEGNDQVVFTDAKTDPFSNYDAFSLLKEAGGVFDSRIGNMNYDIGHVFSTGAGGLAGVGVVCNNSLKANGVTGTSSPVGDPYDVDYVAHELGHQFGARHTFNGNVGACRGNRSSSHAVEPGSGSTIMGYAGICGSQNLQSHSHDYFHSDSFESIASFITIGGGSQCPQLVSMNNMAPVVNLGVGGYVVPAQTPFSLKGNAFDPDEDPITYCWEQMDLGPAGDPMVPEEEAPLFRSFAPSKNSVRHFPQVAALMEQKSLFGELLPDYSRDMTFRLTVRDMKGGVAYDELSFSITDQAGPFEVMSPVSLERIEGGKHHEVRWNVANTDQSPVSCSRVNILLSLDGGESFPYELAKGVSNDGRETVYFPQLLGEKACVKVEAIGNLFFAVSRSFELTSPLALEDAGFNATPVMVFPNPVKERLEWVFNSEYYGECVVRVYDLYGRVWYEEKHMKTGQELAGGWGCEGPSGIYVLEVKTSGEVFEKKVVVE